MVRDYPLSATRQDCDDVVPLFQTVFAAEKFPRHGGFHGSHEGMADEFHAQTGMGGKFFFEMENAQRLGKPPSYQIHAPGAAGPELRANVIDVSHALGVELARQPQMK